MRSRRLHWFDVNADAKQFINTCARCGKQGYVPQIDDDDFAGGRAMLLRWFHRTKLKSMLRKYYKPLPLDQNGNCPSCFESETR